MEVCTSTVKKRVLHINLQMDKLVNLHDVESFFFFFKKKAVHAS